MATVGTPVYPGIEMLREVWTLAAETEAHTAVLNGDRPGVTYSGTPGLTRSFSLANGITVSGIPTPSNGQGTKRATVDTTGTTAFPVTGASAATTQGTKVYFVVADGTLTLAADDGGDPAVDNVFFGVVNLPEGYVVSGTVVPVKIGVVA